MKCHYIYTEDGEKVLIPGCMGTAAMGIENCTCRLKDETENPLRTEIKELEHENAYLNRIIKKLTRNENHTRTTTEIKNRL